MHDLLTDTLPTEWEGRAIDPDFRPMIWLLIRTRRAKTDEDSARMICEAVQRFFVEPVPGVQYQEAFESLVRFCQGGGPEDEERTGTGSSSDPQDEPVLDYRCDADYIVGAFQQAYGIDLTADKVHWWRFMPCRRKRRWARSWRSGARIPPIWTEPTGTTTRP